MRGKSTRNLRVRQNRPTGKYSRVSFSLASVIFTRECHFHSRVSFSLASGGYVQYTSMNEFTCSEHSVRIRGRKKCSTGNQPLPGCFPVMRFFYVRLRTYTQYASMNEFTCSEHSVRIRRSKKRSTGNQPLGRFNSKAIKCVQLACRL